MSSQPITTKRDAAGRFVPDLCPDPNCDGSTRLDADYLGRPAWTCDGLTHTTDDGPLVACERTHDV